MDTGDGSSIVNCPLSVVDRRLLDLIQIEFPLSPRPFDLIGERLSISSSEAMARTTRLKSEGIIRQISAIFDSSALGYTSALVAAVVDTNRLDEAGKTVARHPAVSHCYARDNRFDLWFTLTLEPGHELDSEVETLLAQSGVAKWMVLPALRMFKIGVFLNMAGKDANIGPHAVDLAKNQGGPLADADRAAVRVLQRDIAIVESPFLELASEAGMDEDELLHRAASLRERGAMRRFAAVLKHTRAGYAANAMVCWRVELELVQQIGERFAGHPSVSHCYERPTFPDWPYSLYTMIHCRRDDQLQAVVDELVKTSDSSDHLVLRTVREYKKTRVKYFVGE